MYKRKIGHLVLLAGFSLLAWDIPKAWAVVLPGRWNANDCQSTVSEGGMSCDGTCKKGGASTTVDCIQGGGMVSNVMTQWCDCKGKADLPIVCCQPAAKKGSDGRYTAGTIGTCSKSSNPPCNPDGTCKHLKATHGNGAQIIAGCQ